MISVSQIARKDFFSVYKNDCFLQRLKSESLMMMEEANLISSSRFFQQQIAVRTVTEIERTYHLFLAGTISIMPLQIRRIRGWRQRLLSP